MKKIALLLAVLFIVSLCKAQIKSRVDERVELTSVVFRLAGMHEFVNNDLPGYARSIDEWFAPMCEHPLIAHIGRMRQQTGLAYAGIAASVPYLEIVGGHVRLRSDTPLSRLPETEVRWTESSWKRYIELLDDFYRKSRFRKFYETNDTLYRSAEIRMDSLLRDIDTTWFSRFYGVNLTRPTVFVAVANGPHNYAFDIPSDDSPVGIMIGCRGDVHGEPAFNANSLFVVLHELNHHFSDKVIERYWSDMEPFADTIFPFVQSTLQRYAYDSSYAMITEWLNNLFTLMYYRDHLPSQLVFQTGVLTGRGYPWMPRSVRFMENFYRRPDLYSHIDDFMPQLIAFLKQTAGHIDRIIDEFNRRKPYVVEIYPVPGSSVTTAELSEIRITFSEPMSVYVQGGGAISEDGILPLYTGNDRWNDERTFILSPITDSLRSGKTYGYWLNPYFFLSADNYPLADTVRIAYRILP